MRVIVLAGWAEAGQAIICDFQNKSTVHHAIRWLQISMAANVAVVEVVHSLVERSTKSSIRFTKHTWKHTNLQTQKSYALWVDVWWRFLETGFKAAGRHCHTRTSIKLLLIHLGGRHKVLNVCMLNISWKWWVKPPQTTFPSLQNAALYAEPFVMHGAQRQVDLRPRFDKSSPT